ncbi:hypothetical protein ACIP10_34840 [Streptomyces galbus]|uniref:hypothetical protein n=1 Tax=Streptomyces galbus TaxID=33898 RepID=UPI00380F64CC
MSKAQLVLVVSNRSTKTVELNGAEFDSELYGAAVDGSTDPDGGFCGFYSLAAGQARGCFGKTVTYACGINIGHVGYIWANNVKDNTIPLSTNHYC